MSLPGGAWQDRRLTLEAGVVYFMPPVAKVLVDTAARLGAFEPSAAIRQVLADMRNHATATERLLQLFLALQPHTVSRQMEAGLIDIINRSTTPDLDIHEALDQFVMAGMMSLCPVRSLTTGLAWYEIHSSFYWGTLSG